MCFRRKNNYGMATYDEKTGKVDMKINSKWPVFGPEYKNVSAQFRTTHISDTKSQTIRTYSQLPMPQTNQTYWNGVKYGTAQYVAEDVEELARYEHGLPYRPMGYAIISGSVVRTTRANVAQTSPTGEFGGNYNVNAVKVNKAELQPSIEGIKSAVSAAGFQPPDSTYFFDANCAVLSDGTQASFYPGWINVPRGNPMLYLLFDIGFGANGELSGPNVLNLHSGYWDYTNKDYFTNIQRVAPYFVEIDDKYVVIKRRIFWGDHIINVFDPVYGTSASNNVVNRIKAIEEWAGSEVDITVYLMPYRLEDLL